MKDAGEDPEILPATLQPSLVWKLLQPGLRRALRGSGCGILRFWLWDYSLFRGLLGFKGLGFRGLFGFKGLRPEFRVLVVGL